MPLNNENLKFVVGNYVPPTVSYVQNLIPTILVAPAFNYEIDDYSGAVDPRDTKYAAYGEPTARGMQKTPKVGNTVRVSTAVRMDARCKSTSLDFAKDQEKLIADAKKVLIDLLEKEIYDDLVTCTAKASATYWSGKDIDTVLADIANTKDDIAKACGFQPNAIFGPPKVMNYLCNALMTAGIIPLDMGARFLETGSIQIPRFSDMQLVSANAMMPSSAGVWSNVWNTENCWMGYIDPKPAVASVSSTLGFKAESNIQQSGAPFWIREIVETEKGGHWRCEVHWERAWVKTNANAIRRLTNSAGNGILTAP